jgi:hypothetical protein
MKATWTNDLRSLALALAPGVTLTLLGSANAQQVGWEAVPVNPPTTPVIVAQTPIPVPVNSAPVNSSPVQLKQPLTHSGPTAIAPRTPSVVVPATPPTPAFSGVVLGKPIAKPLTTSVEPGRRPTTPVIRATMSDEQPFPPSPPFLQVAGTDPLRDSGPTPVPTPFPAVELTANDAPLPSVSRTGGPPESVGPVAGDPGLLPGVVADQPVRPTKWYERMGEWFNWGDNRSGQKGNWCSDASFPGLISPVTMPFFFEDPRALTEVRPIFMYQSIPGDTPNVGGGNAWFIGTQARLAFDDRFSLVLSQLGIVGTDGSNPIGPINDDTGFAEVKIGPKYTFLKYTDWGSVAAAGLTFALPVGSSKVYQNTGNLGLTPYLSYGQAFGRLPGGYGALNFMGTTGYSASLNNERSEFFFLNLHLDCNVANANTWFPFVELNWLQYTKAGNRGDFGFEGADLINFGSRTREGSTYFTIAPGLRYRFNDNVYLGAAVELPLAREKGLADYRLTFDMIFRY